MPRKPFLLMVTLLILLSTVSTVLALPGVSSHFTGTLTASDPTFTRFLSACAGSSSGTVHYQTFTVQVSQPGDYYYYDNGWYDGDPTTIDAYVGFFPGGGFNSASPLTNCVDSGDDTATITFPTAGTYTLVVTSFTTGRTGPYDVTFTGPGTISVFQPPAPGAFIFADGRINAGDPGAPVVIYGHESESGHGLVVYSPEGVVLLVVNAEQIAAVADCPAENTPIAGAGPIGLYRLSSCEFQLNAPSRGGEKTYVVIFDNLYSGSGYTSYEG